jgi:hypothetical protein
MVGAAIAQINAVPEDERCPLVRQPTQAAKLARVLLHAAEELWDACTHTNTGDMGKKPAP